MIGILTAVVSAGLMMGVMWHACLPAAYVGTRRVVEA